MRACRKIDCKPMTRYYLGGLDSTTYVSGIDLQRQASTPKKLGLAQQPLSPPSSSPRDLPGLLRPCWRITSYAREARIWKIVGPLMICFVKLTTKNAECALKMRQGNMPLMGYSPDSPIERRALGIGKTNDKNIGRKDFRHTFRPLKHRRAVALVMCRLSSTR